jgi:hypothetical protein
MPILEVLYRLALSNNKRVSNEHIAPYVGNVGVVWFDCGAATLDSAASNRQAVGPLAVRQALRGRAPKNVGSLAICNRQLQSSF